MKSKYCGKIEIKLKECMIWDSLGLIGFRKKCEEKESCVDGAAGCRYRFDRGSNQYTRYGGNRLPEEKAGFDPSETFSIRDYKEGDRMKSIHWKLSYKLDRIMVRDPGAAY